MNLGLRTNIEETTFEDFNSSFIQVRTIPKKFEVYGIILAYIEFCALYLQIPNKFEIFDNFLSNILKLKQDEYDYWLWFCRIFFGKEGGIDFIDNASERNDFINFVDKVIEAMTLKGYSKKTVSAYSFLTKNLKFSIAWAENGKTFNIPNQNQDLFIINLVYKDDKCNILYPKIGYENREIKYELHEDRNKTLLHCGCLIDNSMIRGKKFCPSCKTELYSVEIQILQAENSIFKAQNQILPKKDESLIPKQEPGICPQSPQLHQPPQPPQPLLDTFLPLLLSIFIFLVIICPIIYTFCDLSYSNLANSPAYEFKVKKSIYSQRHIINLSNSNSKEFTILNDPVFPIKEKLHSMKGKKFNATDFILIEDYSPLIGKRIYFLKENKLKFEEKAFIDLENDSGWISAILSSLISWIS